MTRRPVLPGFHPDPSVCRAGDTYYLVCSSFEYAPGVPLFSSTDLRSWEQIGNVLDRSAQLAVSSAPGSGGITAPTIRYHDGRFWMITTNLADGGWQVLVHTDDPLGPWSDPIRIAAPGIDPDLAWDEDGTCYLTYAGFAAGGPAGVMQSVVDLATGEVLTKRRPMWQGTGGRFPEGPHLYRMGDYWYQLIAEGGTERGHAVTIARGSTPYGPFEPCPSNPLLTMRGVESPVQNTGHADLVERPDGSWAIVFHGVRPRGASPQFHVLGRETFAAEVQWEDGWPRLGDWLTPAAEDITDTVGVDPSVGVSAADIFAAAAVSAATDELAGDVLPPSWVSPRRFPADLLRRTDGLWSLSAVDADPSSEDLAFVGRRQRHLYARARATVARGAAVGGLSVRIDARHHVDLEVDGSVLQAVAYVGSIRSVLGELTLGAEGEDIVLEARAVRATGAFFLSSTGPDEIVVGVTTSDGFHELGRLDGRYVSTEVAGGMTGRLIGLWCSRGTLVVRSFSYTGADDADACPQRSRTTTSDQDVAQPTMRTHAPAMEPRDDL